MASRKGANKIKRVIFSNYTVPDLLDTVDTYEVQEILDRRIVEERTKNEVIEKLQYLVKWRGWTSDYNKWLLWFQFNGVDMIKDFERKFLDEGPTYRLHRNDKEEWRPLPMNWKRELQRCHENYLTKLRQRLIAECEVGTPGAPPMESADDAETDIQNPPQIGQVSTDGMQDRRQRLIEECELETSGAPPMESAHDADTEIQNPPTIGQVSTDGMQDIAGCSSQGDCDDDTRNSQTDSIQHMTVTSVPVDAAKTSNIQGSAITSNAFNIVLQNVNVHIISGKRKVEPDEDRTVKAARIASVGYDSRRMVTFARNCNLPVPLNYQHCLDEISSNFVERPPISCSQVDSSFLPRISTHACLSGFPFSSVGNSLPLSISSMNPFGFLPVGMPLLPYAHASPPSAVGPITQFYVPNELMPAVQPAQTMLQSEFFMRQPQMNSAILNQLGYVPRLTWDDGSGTITVSSNSISWSARRQPDKRDE